MLKGFFLKFDCIRVSNIVFSRAEGSDTLSSKSRMQNFQSSVSIHLFENQYKLVKVFKSLNTNKMKHTLANGCLRFLG
jgi:hypothetical protein